VAFPSSLWVTFCCASSQLSLSLKGCVLVARGADTPSAGFRAVRRRKRGDQGGKGGGDNDDEEEGNQLRGRGEGREAGSRRRDKGRIGGRGREGV
jgi:hypothetical protein